MYDTGYMRIKSILSKKEIYCRIILNKWYILIKNMVGKKIKDIGLHTIGSVWTKDGKYYYFDDLGNNQLVKNTVFEINDKNVVNELLSNSNKISIDRIRDIINQKQMQVVDGKVQFKAPVKYGMDYRIVLVLVLVVVIFIYLLERRYKEWGTDYK